MLINLEEIDATLSDLIPKEASPLFNAARYALQGGKRLRPLLTLATAATFGAPIEKGLYPACAIELIHTYSLIHDDLPCIDNDDLRRGRATLHRLYCEGTALLTGDFLLTLTFEVLAKAPHLTESQKIKMVQLVAKGAGSGGMIGGQLLDLARGPLSEETLLYIHGKKTAALMEAAMGLGAIAAKAPLYLEPLMKIGHYVGIAFQLLDDLSDGDGAVKIVGKERANYLANDFMSCSFDLISRLPGQGEILRAHVENMFESRSNIG